MDCLNELPRTSSNDDERKQMLNRLNVMLWCKDDARGDALEPSDVVLRYRAAMRAGRSRRQGYELRAAG